MMLRRRSAASLLVGLSLVAAACTSGASDPEADLAAAIEHTLDDSFAYRLTAQADRDALDVLGEGAEAAAAFLRGLSLAGSVGDGFGQLELVVLGQRLLEVRRTAPERTSVRLSLGDVPGVPEALRDPSALLPALVQLGLGERVEVAVATLLGGDWVRVDGSLDLAAILAAVSDGAQQSQTSTTDDVEQRVRRFVDVVEHSESDGRRVFRIELRLRDAVAALRAGGQDAGRDADRTATSVPETIPGSVFVEDDVVTRVRFDIGQLTDPAEQAGTVELQLDVTDHGRVRAPLEPPSEVTIGADELVEAFATFLRFVAGVGAP